MLAQKNNLVSIIIPVKNEGFLLKQTIESINGVKTNTPFEIIVVDDGSNDHCCDFIRQHQNAGLIKLVTTDGLGSAMARNCGAEMASGEYLIFCDAHLTFQDDWMEKLLRPMLNGEADAVNPGIGDSGNPGNIGYGYTWDQQLDPKWNVGKENPFYTPLLAGGCLAISSKVFLGVGGFEKGFRIWGREDEEFSLKLWLFGYRCMVVPDVTILHYFRSSTPPFQITWDDINWNLLRMAYSHFNEERILKCKSLIKYSDPDKMEEQLLASDIIEQRSEYFGRRKYGEQWFMDKFGISF